MDQLAAETVETTRPTDKHGQQQVPISADELAKQFMEETPILSEQTRADALREVVPWTIPNSFADEELMKPIRKAEIKRKIRETKKKHSMP